MTKHLRDRRRLGRFGLAALVVVLGVGVWQGVAAATSGQTVDIQKRNSNCGRSTGTHAIGTATFYLEGTDLVVDVNLTNADPDTKYDIVLYSVKPGNNCRERDEMGELDTDGNGQGQGEYSSQVDPKKQKYFIDVAFYGCPEAPHAKPACGAPNGPDVRSEDNDSLIVKLDPS